MIIYKYPLQITALQYITIPSQLDKIGVLAVQLQRNVPTLWVNLEPHETIESCVPIICLGTGHYYTTDSSKEYTYLGTVQLDGFVWHYYSEI